MSVRLSHRRERQPRYLRHNSDPAPTERAAAHRRGKPEETRMPPWPERVERREAISDGPAHEAKWTLGVADERHEVCRRVAHRVAIDRYQVSDPEAVENRSQHKGSKGLRIFVAQSALYAPSRTRLHRDWQSTVGPLG